MPPKKGSAISHRAARRSSVLREAATLRGLPAEFHEARQKLHHFFQRGLEERFGSAAGRFGRFSWLMAHWHTAGANEPRYATGLRQIKKPLRGLARHSPGRGCHVRSLGGHLKDALM